MNTNQKIMLESLKKSLEKRIEYHEAKANERLARAERLKIDLIEVNKLLKQESPDVVIAQAQMDIAELLDDEEEEA